MHVLVIKGGFSSERDVSLASSEAVEKAIVELGYQLTVYDLKKDNILDFIPFAKKCKPDVIFNALHGPFGEDGRIQVFFDLLGIPYTSSGVEASAVGLDKTKSRMIFQAAGLCVPAWRITTWEEVLEVSFVPKPYMIKPIAEGSSIGVSMITNNGDLIEAKKNWKYGDQFIVEPFLRGRELTAGVVDGQYFGTLEIKPKFTFFDFNAKYNPTAVEELPAVLTELEERQIKYVAELAYEVLNCKGIARVDLIQVQERFYVLEINTQPGLTVNSLFPKIAANKGMTFNQLIDKIIDSALNPKVVTGIQLPQAVGNL